MSNYIEPIGWAALALSNFVAFYAINRVERREKRRFERKMHDLNKLSVH